MIGQSPFRDDRCTPPQDKRLYLATQEDVGPLRQTSRERFCGAVRKAQQRIVAGEAFQIVLSQEFLIDRPPPAEAVYAALRDINPSPYMIYFRTPELTLVGASPEMLVRVDGRQITYRPIAGTRLRTGDAAADQRAVEELLVDPKERCEHQMLVDLGRNDLGRVAKIGSVRVENPFHVEQYAHVFHIVSNVIGEMRDDVSSLDVVRSVFPAGTLTGRRNCGPWKSSANWRHLHAASTAGHSATSISPETWTWRSLSALFSSATQRRRCAWRRHRQRQRARARGR